MSTDQPTMKELCAKATPGPYVARPDLADSPSKHLWLSPVYSGGCNVANGRHPSIQGAAIQAQLIARCSPEVILRVVEALEEMATDIWKRKTDDDPLLIKVREALALLNGETTP